MPELEKATERDDAKDPAVVSPPLHGKAKLSGGFKLAGGKWLLWGCDRHYTIMKSLERKSGVPLFPPPLIALKHKILDSEFRPSKRKVFHITA